MSKLSCYLRTHRRAWRLTQDNLAALLPRGDRNRVSDVERSKAPPNAAEIIAYAVIFGLSPRQLFPQYFAEVEETVIRNAYALHQALSDDRSPPAARKRVLLLQMLNRATNRSQPTPEL